MIVERQTNKKSKTKNKGKKNKRRKKRKETKGTTEKKNKRKIIIKRAYIHPSVKINKSRVQDS